MHLCKSSRNNVYNTSRRIHYICIRVVLHSRPRKKLNVCEYGEGSWRKNFFYIVACTSFRFVCIYCKFKDTRSIFPNITAHLLKLFIVRTTKDSDVLTITFGIATYKYIWFLIFQRECCWNNRRHFYRVDWGRRLDKLKRVKENIENLFLEKYYILINWYYARQNSEEYFKWMEGLELYVACSFTTNDQRLPPNPFTIHSCLTNETVLGWAILSI